MHWGGVLPPNGSSGWINGKICHKNQRFSIDRSTVSSGGRRMVHSRTIFTIRRIDGGVSVIDVKGEITGFTENEMVRAYTQAVQSGGSLIAWNFNQLDYMNSSGIGLLLTLVIRARKQGVRMCAFGLNEHYMRVFEMSRLNEAIQLFETEDEVLKTLQLVHG
jgi:anti-sigma B factor antagonist